MSCEWLDLHNDLHVTDRPELEASTTEHDHGDSASDEHVHLVAEELKHFVDHWDLLKNRVGQFFLLKLRRLDLIL